MDLMIFSSKSQLRLALFQPDIPQNTGAILRLAACLGIGVDIIEPCGFVFSEKRLRRAGMDYLEHVNLKLHPSWQFFHSSHTGSDRRLILLTTKSKLAYTSFKFYKKDTLLLGRESAGVPDKVHDMVDARLTIPMERSMRSLNVTQSASMVLGEALRQLNLFSEANLRHTSY